MTHAQQTEYSDAASADPAVRAGFARLEELKAHLRNDAELGSRVFDYSVEWDSVAGTVTGLEPFGELVFDQLWAALDEETAAFKSQPVPDWMDQERLALAEFVEHRSRVFVGRGALLDWLEDFARLGRVAAGADSPPCRGMCVVGTSGAGKSALFAALYRRLAGDPSLLLLANSAGATRRGASVDAMLRRWIGETHAFAGDPSASDQGAGDAGSTMEDVETAFRNAIARACGKGRVVLLLVLLC